jgi:hypothetical protein
MTTISATGEVLIKQQDALTPMEYSTDGGNKWKDIDSWPVTLINTEATNASSKLTVKFKTNLWFTSVDQYFIIGTNTITIDGNEIVLFIDVYNYPGIIQNGTENVIGNYSVVVKNIITNIGAATSIADYGGTICQQYFGNGAINNTVKNCINFCPTSSNGGGIIGAYSGAVSASYCSSYGSVAEQGGGIFGSYSSGSATYCNSYCAISENGGGIFGREATETAYATNCTLSSVDNFPASIADSAGGIFGSNSYGTADTCVTSVVIGSYGGGIFARYCYGYAYNCFSTGNIDGYGGGIFGSDSVGAAISCASYGTIGSDGGGILGNSCGGSATDCYSSGLIYAEAGGIAGYGSYAIVTNCGSTGDIQGEAGGIFGKACKATAMNCWSTGYIGSGGYGGGGIFGSYCAYGVAQNCYSTGDIGTSSGGIFGQDTGTSPVDTYLTDAIIALGFVACAVSGLALVGAIAVSTEAVAGLVILSKVASSSSSFIPSGVSKGQVINCYVTGRYNASENQAYAGLDSDVNISNSYAPNGLDNWNDYDANNSLDINSGAWTSPDLAAINVPYILSSLTTTLLYDPSFNTNASTSGEGFEYCSHSIISINGFAQENYPGITIDSSSGIITFGEESLTTPETYVVNVLATYGLIYYSGTFTNTITMYNPSSASNETSSGNAFFSNCTYSIETINGNDPSEYPTISIHSNTGNITFSSTTPNQTTYAVYVKANPTSGEKFYGTYTNSIAYFAASDTVLVQQTTSVSSKNKNKNKSVASEIQYSTDNGVTWTPITVWPVTIINTSLSPESRLTVQFNTGLTLDSVDQYFIMGTNDINVDGLNNIVNINVDKYRGLFQNGTSTTNGKSNITIKNIGVSSSYTLADNGGWLGQTYFGKNGLYTIVNHCYSTGGNIGNYGGGILGSSCEAQAINCYSTSTIFGTGGGGIAGAYSSAQVSVCYSTGDIVGIDSGGLHGAYASSLANAFNSYSTGDIIGIGSGGVIGAICSAGVEARNCYSMGTVGGKYSGGVFGQNSSTESLANNCYSLGTVSGEKAAYIFGFGDFGSSPYCYFTKGRDNWKKTDANAALNTSENVWTDIDPYVDGIPYKLTAFYLNQTLYSPSSGTNVSTETPVASDFVEWVITSVNGSTSYSGVSINNSTGVLTFDSLAAASYLVNVVAVDSFRFYSFGTFTNIISNICFPAGTPIVTDQGIIPIDKIKTSLHTIRNKKIVAITKTVTADKYLVKFDRDSLGMNMPSKTTVMSKHHSVYFNGRVMEAKEFTHEFSNVTKIPYKGEVLYNVLLEEHDKIMVNNLTCETLHPDHLVARLYKVLPTLSARKQMELIMKCNQSSILEKSYNGVGSKIQHTSTFRRSPPLVKKNGAKMKLHIHF